MDAITCGVCGRRGYFMGNACPKCRERSPGSNRSKRRYQRFLDFREIRPDLTFNEFLTSDTFAEARK